MTQPAIKDSGEFFDTDMSVGEILRRTRMHYGQSLTDVERSIRVRASQIAAIENDRTDELPGRVYAIGFVRSYSEYLGLDGGKMVELFKRQQGTKPKDPSLDFPIPASESKVPPIWLVLLSLLVTFGGPYLLWNYFTEAPSDVNEVAAVPDHLKVESLSLMGDQGGAQESMALAHDRPEIFLNVIEDSWVEIKDGEGEVLISKILEAGEQYYIPNRPDLLMTVANAGGIEFEISEGEFIAFGEKGEAKSDIPLDLQYLSEYFAAGGKAADNKKPEAE